MLAPLLLTLLPLQFDKILDDPKLEGAIVSAVVTKLDGTPIYERNPGLHMVPASNQKLLSNAFAEKRASFELWARKGKVVAEPSNFGVNIYATTGEGPLSIVYDPFRRMVTVNGKLPAADTRIDTLSVLRPDREAAFLLGDGFVPTRLIPTSAPDFVIPGKPLSEMIAACLKPSDNNIAEHLLMLGALSKGELPRQPYPVARERMKDFLVTVVGIPSNDVKPFDGSGMSRHNYVTTRGIAKLLKWAHEQETATLWKESMATPGSGTLANRLTGIGFQGKTGTLNMVVALSGYVKHRSGEDLIASVILNQYGCTAAEARGIVDAFIKEASEAELDGYGAR